MALLHRLRDGNQRLRVAGPGRKAVGRRGLRPRAVSWVLLAVVVGCKGQPNPEFRPDETLKRELGLTDLDEVHRVTLTGAEAEAIDSPSVTVAPGAYVEFVTADWRIHEVHFELDSLDAPARSFLERSDQASSPPLVDRDSRFVVWFDRAPPGRYSYVVQGNGASARGVVIVRPNP